MQWTQKDTEDLIKLQHQSGEEPVPSGESVEGANPVPSGEGPTFEEQQKEWFGQLSKTVGKEVGSLDDFAGIWEEANQPRDPEYPDEFLQRADEWVRQGGDAHTFFEVHQYDPEEMLQNEGELDLLFWDARLDSSNRTLDEDEIWDLIESEYPLYDIDEEEMDESEIAEAEEANRRTWLRIQRDAAEAAEAIGEWQASRSVPDAELARRAQEEENQKKIDAYNQNVDSLLSNDFTFKMGENDGYTFKMKDENGQMNPEVKTAIEALRDPMSFLSQFMNKDGSLNASAIFRNALLSANYQQIAQNIATNSREAGNAEIVDQLQNPSVTTDSGKKPTTDKNYTLDAVMKMWGG